MDMDRRSFLKGGLVVGGTAALSSLAACTPNSGTPQAKAANDNIPKPFTQEDFDNSTVVLDPISKVSDEKSYDIVVIGAGTSGLPAVLTALEEGCTVACLQKESVPVSQGSGSSGFILDECTEKGLLEWKQTYREAVSFRENTELVDFFIQHSGETLCWMDQMGEAAGFPAAVHTMAFSKQFADDSIARIAQHFFGTKPQSNNDLIVALASYAESLGAEFFYSTPAVQLITNESGAVTGVFGKTKSGDFVQFNASKAVIVATGDYQNNESMVERFSPDLSRFSKKQVNKTGDGILMCAAAGGFLTPVGHCKQMHDMDAAPLNFAECPWLAVDLEGNRFMNEEIPMISWNLALRENTKAEDPGKFCRIFDANFVEQQKSWGPVAEGGVVLTTEEQLEPYIPGLQENPKGVFKDLINTHRCDTLEELAKELDVPFDTLKKTIDRYNELAKSGFDKDFGKDPKYLAPIETPPFWGIRQWMRVTAICSGITVDGNYQVVDQDRNPIPGLYAVGFGAGDLCGDVDWSFYLGGLSCGSCMTSGRYATIHAITGSSTPSKPAKWDDVKDLYAAKK